MYHKNIMPNNTGSPTSVNTIAVDNSACDSLLNYITEKKAWTIKGDSEDGFCADGNKHYNINDAEEERLWVITKKAAVNLSYYAPDYYENVVLNNARFISSITKMIAALFAKRCNRIIITVTIIINR